MLRRIELDCVVFEFECIMFKRIVVIVVVILLLWLRSWFLIVEGVEFVLLNLELAVVVSNSNFEPGQYLAVPKKPHHCDDFFGISGFVLI